MLVATEAPSVPSRARRLFPRACAHPRAALPPQAGRGQARVTRPRLPAVAPSSPATGGVTGQRRSLARGWRARWGSARLGGGGGGRAEEPEAEGRAPRGGAGALVRGGSRGVLPLLFFPLEIAGLGNAVRCRRPDCPGEGEEAAAGRGPGDRGPGAQRGPVEGARAAGQGPGARDPGGWRGRGLRVRLGSSAFFSLARCASRGAMDPGPRPSGSGCSSPAGLSREYKLVMLGAGGVGKSGRCPCASSSPEVGVKRARLHPNQVAVVQW